MPKISKLTPFGREARKLRIDRQEIQADVARALGVSVAFWSSIETGKKNIPLYMLDRLIEHMGVSDADASDLRLLAEMSREEVTINMTLLSDPGREVVVGLAWKLEKKGLTEQQLARLRDILDSKD